MISQPEVKPVQISTMMEIASIPSPARLRSSLAVSTPPTSEAFIIFLPTLISSK